MQVLQHAEKTGMRTLSYIKILMLVLLFACSSAKPAAPGKGNAKGGAKATNDDKGSSDDDEIQPIGATCGGKKVDTGCWYLASDADETCTFTCSAHTAYDETTASFAGSGGTKEHCGAVIEALIGAAPGASLDSPSGTEAAGCSLLATNIANRITSPATTADAKAVTGQKRACSCKS